MANHIYIHIPFCIKKCGYCSFYSVVYDEDLVEKYVDFLSDEIETSPLPPPKRRGSSRVQTIYFGGGTPSLLKPLDIEKIISKFDLSDVKEITLEVNPATVFFNKNDNKSVDNSLGGCRKGYSLSDYRGLGINRLSLGTQSMKDTELEFLGRVHKVQDVISLYENGLSEIFENISHDLIYGLPNQSLSDVEYSLREILKFKPEHLSIYNLSLEENVPLYKYNSQLPSDDLVADMYYLIRDIMLGNGYVQYELSSFCKPNKESLHNLSYWSFKDYLGFGAGACGFVDGYRYENPELEGYIASKRINPPNPSKIPPTPLYKGGNMAFFKKGWILVKDLEKEYIITGLRKAEGISLSDYEERFGHSFLEKYSKPLKKMLENGYIEVDNFIRLCPDYYFTSNEVLCEFI